jgi:hypothetical protein
VSVEKSVNVVRNVVNVYEGDLHLHNDTHNHLYGSPRKPRHKAVEVRVEVVQEPQRSREKAVKVRIEVSEKPARDERCERLMREHLERVKGWEAMFR